MNLIFFAEVKRQFRGFLAEALTLGNLHTRIFMIFYFMMQPRDTWES